MRTLATDENNDIFTGPDGFVLVSRGLVAVAELAEARLALWQGDWFLDRPAGVPFKKTLLGYASHGDPVGTARKVITAEILKCPEVVGVSSVQVMFNRTDRHLIFKADVSTVYGAISI